MGRKLLLILTLSLWLIATPTWAGCLVPDLSTWTPDQKRLVKELAYAKAAQAGHDEFPTFASGQLCFVTFDPTGVVTEAGMLAQYVTDRKIDADAGAVEQAAKAELATLDAQLEPDDTDWATLTTVQKLAAMKRLLRREVLKRRLGR